MSIQHTHLDISQSTQEELRQYVKDQSPHVGHTLISTEQQMAGFGRQGAKWQHFDHALAFSFTLTPSQTLTLTPLEIGALLGKFFSPKLQLKWPNDMMNEKREKVGGIISQYYKDIIIVGIGLNLVLDKSIDTQSFPYPIGGVFDELNLKENFKSELPLEIYQYILEHRLSDEEIKEEWTKLSYHLHQQVTIEDDQVKTTGTFIGLGTNGEAILRDQQGEKIKVLTGSLRFN